MSETTAYQQSPVSSGSIVDSPTATTLSVDGNSVSSIGESITDNILTKVQSEPIKPTYVSKTDKPRPHICATCQRSFARLEHLKRHERSHTKEKPFECPQCTRCFARRDLLLRHQQKLHLTDTPSVKSSKGRRDSLNSVASGKIRKNSATAAAVGAAARPRANTTGHVDGRTLGIMQNMNRHINSQGEGSVDYTQFLNAGQSHANMQAMQASGPNGLRLATNGLHNIDHAEGALRTAPAVPGFNGNFSFSPMHAGGSTVNPAQLHMGEGQHQGGFGAMDTGAIDDDDNFDWLRNYQNRYPHSHDQALESSPSMMSHTSDLNMHGTEGFSQAPHEAMMWQRHASMSGPFPDHSVSIPPDMMHINPSAPQFGHFPDQQQVDHLYRTPPQVHAISPNTANGFSPQLPHQVVYGSDGSNSVSSISMNGSSGRHSSITSVSTDTITDVTRSALLKSLSQPQQLSHGSRKFSQPAVSSPLRETFRGQVATGGLPSTQDLQRYVGAYIQYFHPHFPFLHIGTLSFDTPAYTNHLRPALSPGQGSGRNQQQLIGGGGCLVLAMAAIGALYEQDQPASRELFVAAKKMIQLYLEERRKVDAKMPKDQALNTTPLWLVQAMLLNVIYGHNCSDKISGDIAETHCAALIQLASSAGLLSPLAESNIGKQYYNDGHRLSPISETPGHEPTLHNNPFGMGISIPDENHQWHRWVALEERKRALYAIFHMSSLLVASYNHPPALMNSAVEHDLPCEESLWNADNASAWMSLGGNQLAQQNSISFANALSMLLNASRTEVDYRRLTQQQSFGSGVPMQVLPPSPLKPCTFGCLVLIDALHNYIWETRQRHTGRKWTTQETESMHAHIEPALRAWQAAWASNPLHSLERPNPHGVGPLSADCIPLLDLAYVRLFVSFGAAKEAFWSRDFDAMSEELARGSEFMQHADHSEGNTASNTAQNSRNSPEPVMMSNGLHSVNHDATHNQQAQYSKRERQLRKAAFYAADSLSMANKLGVTFADFTSRELPLQAGLCTFDCAQILAEWVSTVQERVGRYIGVLGRDNIDFGNVPAIMLLEGEDVNLLQKIDEILRRAEAKMTVAMNNMQGSIAMLQMQKLPSNSNKGFGSKILTVTAHMFERNEIWPVFHTMAEGLDFQAEHMSRRAENSTRQSGQVN